MTLKIQKNNHCSTRLLWEDEYPMNYLYTSSKNYSITKIKLFPSEEKNGRSRSKPTKVERKE